MLHIVGTFLAVLRLANCKTTEEEYDYENTPSPTWQPQTAKQIEDALKKSHIIPDILSKAPEHNANIMFYDLPLGLGCRILVPYQLEYHPTWFEWPAKKNRLYTFIMTDLDYPTRKNPSGREFLVWLIGNIPEQEGLHGKKIVKYVGYQPSKDPDPHRYLVTIYEQPKPKESPISFEEDWLKSRSAIKNRTGFSTIKFAEKYKLGEPIAVDFAYVNVSGPTD